MAAPRALPGGRRSLRGPLWVPFPREGCGARGRTGAGEGGASGRPNGADANLLPWRWPAAGLAAFIFFWIKKKKGNQESSPAQETAWKYLAWFPAGSTRASCFRPCQLLPLSLSAAYGAPNVTQLSLETPLKGNRGPLNVRLPRSLQNANNGIIYTLLLFHTSLLGGRNYSEGSSSNSPGKIRNVCFLFASSYFFEDASGKELKALSVRLHPISSLTPLIFNLSRSFLKQKTSSGERGLSRRPSRCLPGQSEDAGGTGWWETGLGFGTNASPNRAKRQKDARVVPSRDFFLQAGGVGSRIQFV